MKKKKICGGLRTPNKKRFTTLAEVQFAIQRAAELKTKLWHYRCPDCNTYHLTSRPPRNAPALVNGGR